MLKNILVSKKILVGGKYFWFYLVISLVRVEVDFRGKLFLGQEKTSIYENLVQSGNFSVDSRLRGKLFLEVGKTSGFENFWFDLVISL